MAEENFTVPTWVALDLADGDLNNAEIALDMMGEAACFRFANADEAGRAQERIVVLMNAIRGNIRGARRVLQRETENTKSMELAHG